MTTRRLPDLKSSELDLGRVKAMEFFNLSGSTWNVRLRIAMAQVSLI